MNTRLVWNFEINNEKLLKLTSQQESYEELHWEARFFWPGDAIISLNGFDERFLVLSNYNLKHRDDYYYLLPNADYNIKQRRQQLFYKPILEKAKCLNGYGKKINLSESSPELILSGSKTLTVAELAKDLQESPQAIEVKKEAFVYKFSTDPLIKLELARLEINKTIYFSLCIEGHSQKLVASIAAQLLPAETCSDYVSFLKQIQRSC
ncbi:MAG: hypothetical protein H0U70_06995 [Tatlockia sp.]|nr:hypothetical protein [Tatlockia sp.]